MTCDICTSEKHKFTQTYITLKDQRKQWECAENAGMQFLHKNPHTMQNGDE